MHTQELTIDELMAMQDDEIDLSDIPEADDEFWKDAQVLKAYVHAQKQPLEMTS